LECSSVCPARGVVHASHCFWHRFGDLGAAGPTTPGMCLPPCSIRHMLRAQHGPHDDATRYGQEFFPRRGCLDRPSSALQRGGSTTRMWTARGRRPTSAPAASTADMNPSGFSGGRHRAPLCAASHCTGGNREPGDTRKGWLQGRPWSCRLLSEVRSVIRPAHGTANAATHAKHMPQCIRG
jgi:hypothetical protein